MERYVIRIYHRDPKDPKRIIGSVEAVGMKKRRGFLGPDSLWRILSSQERVTERRGETRKKTGKRDDFKSFSEIMGSIQEEEGKGNEE